MTQTLASRILLFSITIYSFLIEWNYFLIEKKYLINLIFSSSLILKSGIAPFHFWFPNVIEGINWINNFILITWQKIAPLFILTFCLNLYLIFYRVCLSALIGSLGGLNQTSLRKIIAYSSINHLRWIISRILRNENILKIYFLFYTFLNFSIISTFKNFNIFNLRQIFIIIFKKKIIKFLLILPLFSLGGLPPFLGFFPKWIVIEILIYFNLFFLLIILTLFSLITFYFYLRISYSSILLNFNKINFNFYYLNKIKNFSNFLLINIFFSIFGLIFINIIFLI